jgi:DNA-binding phage protein
MCPLVRQRRGPFDAHIEDDRSARGKVAMELQDPEFAAAYLEDALSESLEEFLIALRKYVQATGECRDPSAG